MSQRDYPPVWWPSDALPEDPWSMDPWPSEDPEGRRALDLARSASGSPLASRWVQLAEARTSSSPPEEPRAQRLPTVDELVRVACDLLPQAGNDGPHHALGPWVEQLEPRLPQHHQALLHATAALAFVPISPQRAAPATQQARRSRSVQLSAQVRQGLRAVSWAPMGLWQLGDAWQGGHRLVDRIGLPPQVLPEGPVHLGQLGLVAGPVGPGDTLVARVAVDERGWRVAVGFGIPGRPPQALVDRWVRWVVLERRLRAPSMPRVVALRRWGHELARYAHEWAWLRLNP